MSKYKNVLLIDGYVLAGQSSLTEFNFVQEVKFLASKGYTIHGYPIVFNNKIIQAMIKYFDENSSEENLNSEIEGRKLLDFEVTWHSNIHTRQKRKDHLISEGFEFFKEEKEDHHGLKSYKLMMVKYEQ